MMNGNESKELEQGRGIDQLCRKLGGVQTSSEVAFETVW